MAHPVVELRSDNTASVAPRILDAIIVANHGTAKGYGGDDTTARLEAVVRERFEHPTARVFPVTSGTAANALSLSAMTPPWGGVWCHDTAHILTNEGGATSMLSGGAVMRGVGGDNFLVDPITLRSQLESVGWGDNHRSQPAVLSLTQTSDFGTVYQADEVRTLAAIAAEYGMTTHLDGARISNAIVATGSGLAEMTWQAGVSTVSLGATKNGAMSAEAIVTFDDDVANELFYRTKRAGHVTSKMRYQSAQLIAYLTDDHWRELAANANARMAQIVDLINGHIADGGRIELVNRVDANIAFIRVAAATADRWERDGLRFYRIGDMVRFVTNWSTTDDDVAAVSAVLASSLS